MQPNDSNQDRVNYIHAMGCDLGNLCYEVRHEVESLQYRWYQAQVLFQRGSDRIDLLNTVASNFFGLVRALLFEDAMLHLCRLTDPPKTFGHENLTLMRLAELIPDQSLRERVKTEADGISKKCQFARGWRNQRLAHMSLHASPLPEVTVKNVEDALQAMREFLDSVERHYGVPPVPFVAYDPSSAGSLIDYLEEAVRAKQDEDQL